MRDFDYYFPEGGEPGGILVLIFIVIIAIYLPFCGVQSGKANAHVRMKAFAARGIDMSENDCYWMDNAEMEYLLSKQPYRQSTDLNIRLGVSK